MTFLRNVWRDLVEKRLWPVAAGLLLAAIAVPLLVHTGSSTPAPAATPAVAGAATAPNLQITTAVAPTGKVRRDGAVRNPFQPKVFLKEPKAATPGASATATATPSSTQGGVIVGGSGGTGGGAASSRPSSSGTATPSGGGSSSGTSTSRPQGDGLPGKGKYVGYTLSVQLKRAGKSTHLNHIFGFRYLPYKAYPLLAYMGIDESGKHALFSVLDGVEVSGADRTCLPSRANCRFLQLDQGDDVLFTLPPDDPSKAKHYRLIVKSISLRHVELATKSTRRASARSAALGTTDPGTIRLGAAR